MTAKKITTVGELRKLLESCEDELSISFLLDERETLECVCATSTAGGRAVYLHFDSQKRRYEPTYLKSEEDKYKVGSPDWAVVGFGHAEMWTGRVETDDLVYLRIPKILDLEAEYSFWEKQKIQKTEIQNEFWEYLLTKGAEKIEVTHWID